MSPKHFLVSCTCVLCLHNQHCRIGDVWHTLLQARVVFCAILCIHNKSFNTRFDCTHTHAQHCIPLLVAECTFCMRAETINNNRQKNNTISSATKPNNRRLSVPCYRLHCVFVLELDCDRTRRMASVWRVCVLPTTHTHFASTTAQPPWRWAGQIDVCCVAAGARHMCKRCAQRLRNHHWMLRVARSIKHIIKA